MSRKHIMLVYPTTLFDGSFVTLKVIFGKIYHWVFFDFDTTFSKKSFDFCWSDLWTCENIKWKNLNTLQWESHQKDMRYTGKGSGVVAVKATIWGKQQAQNNKRFWIKKLLFFHSSKYKQLTIPAHLVLSWQPPCNRKFILPGWLILTYCHKSGIGQGFSNCFL